MLSEFGTKKAAGEPVQHFSQCTKNKTLMCNKVDIKVDGILAGRRSGENQESLKRWLTERKARNR